MSSAPVIHPVQRTTAHESVREELLRLIKAGSLRIGDKLPSEHELARSFGVSRPVIREALGSLRAMGFIHSRTGSGSFIASTRFESKLLLGRYSTADLAEVRRNAEIPGAGFAAVRRTDDDLAAIFAILDTLEAATSPKEWVELDVAFHLALAKATRNRVHERLVADLRELLVEHSFDVFERQPDRIAKSNAEHRQIYAAVAAGDAPQAERLMAQHLFEVATVDERP